LYAVNLPETCANFQELHAPRPKLPPLTDGERAEVGRLYDDFDRASEAQRLGHARRLWRLARGLGERVGAGELTVRAAEERLDAATLAPDPDSPIPRGILPLAVGRSIVADAFAVGIRKARTNAR
jgi:hypothetical protein